MMSPYGSVRKLMILNSISIQITEGSDAVSNAEVTDSAQRLYRISTIPATIESIKGIKAIE